MKASKIMTSVYDLGGKDMVKSMQDEKSTLNMWSDDPKEVSSLNSTYNYILYHAQQPDHSHPPECICKKFEWRNIFQLRQEDDIGEQVDLEMEFTLSLSMSSSHKTTSIIRKKYIYINPFDYNNKITINQIISRATAYSTSKNNNENKADNSFASD